MVGLKGILSSGQCCKTSSAIPPGLKYRCGVAMVPATSQGQGKTTAADLPTDAGSQVTTDQ